MRGVREVVIEQGTRSWRVEAGEIEVYGQGRELGSFTKLM
jgi:hypothetical protein